MSKIRINELARQLEVKSREVIDKLHELGIAEKVTHSSSIDEDKADQLRRYYSGESHAPRPHHAPGTAPAPQSRSAARRIRGEPAAKPKRRRSRRRRAPRGARAGAPIRPRSRKPEPAGRSRPRPLAGSRRAEAGQEEKPRTITSRARFRCVRRCWAAALRSIRR